MIALTRASTGGAAQLVSMSDQTFSGPGTYSIVFRDDESEGPADELGGGVRRLGSMLSMGIKNIEEIAMIGEERETIRELKHQSKRPQLVIMAYPSFSIMSHRRIAPVNDSERNASGSWR
jgi:hypothetical protein